jgi:hypothetical protein
MTAHHGSVGSDGALGRLALFLMQDDPRRLFSRQNSQYAD